jgi:polyisoprenoid-binding protein YceI
MESRTRSLLLIFLAGLVSLPILTGCPARPRGPESPPPVGVPPATTTEAPRHEGRPYDVVSSESLLTILAFRGGTLAKAGHNHVIASHDVSGTFYVPEDVLRSTFELQVPVALLSIDEPELRSKEGPEFPAEVPESAKEGTRRNMLSEALLNGAQYPHISLISQRIERGTMGTSVNADVQVTVRGQSHTIEVPVAYTLEGGQLVAAGDLPIKQTDLGLTPFSAMLGALQVQDELRVRFRIVAKQIPTHGAGVGPAVRGDSRGH